MDWLKEYETFKSKVISRYGEEGLRITDGEFFIPCHTENGITENSISKRFKSILM